MVAAVAAVALVAALVAVVVAVAVAVYDHVGLDRFDHPCPLQLPAEYPVGPQLAGVLCTHTQCASLPHPQELLPLLAASLPPVLQLVQLMSSSLPPAVLPGHGRSDLQRPEAELQRAPHGLPMSERAPQQRAHALLHRQAWRAPPRSSPRPLRCPLHRRSNRSACTPPPHRHVCIGHCPCRSNARCFCLQRRAPCTSKASSIGIQDGLQCVCVKDTIVVQCLPQGSTARSLRAD